MPFTKAPTDDTHNVKRIPAGGSPFVVSDPDNTNPAPTTLSYIDCFTQKEKQWNGQEKTSVMKRQGWTTFGSVGTTSNTSATLCRSVVLAEGEDSLYFGRNDTFYRVSAVSTSSPSIGSIVGSVSGMQYASGTNAINNSNAKKICYLDNAYNLYTWSEDGSGPTTTNLSSSYSITPTGYRNLVFLDGYLFAADTSNRIYNSGAGGVLTTWSSTDFIIPEQFPDGLQWMEVHHNYLVAFGTRSTEFFYDAGVEVGSPLARQESYAAQIGIYHTGFPGKVAAKLDDDVYFIGVNSANKRALYSLKNFRITQIPNQYFEGRINWRGTLNDVANTSVEVYGVEPFILNNNQAILISLSDGTTLGYYPDEDSWFEVSTSTQSSPLNSDIPGWSLRIGYSELQSTYNASTNVQPLIPAVSAAGSTTINIKVPDYSNTVTVTSRVYTEVIDFGNNREKHIARIDAIGDYGNNTIALAYNPSPNYDYGYTTTETKTPQTYGYQNNISWYNIGAFRRFSLRLDITGTGPAIHEGMEAEINQGVA